MADAATGARTGFGLIVGFGLGNKLILSKIRGDEVCSSAQQQPNQEIRDEVGESNESEG